MNETTDASAIFAPLWRRKWLILAVAIVAAVGSYLYYRREPPKFASSTQIYLANGAEEEARIGGSSSGGSKKAATAQPTTQAALINTSIVKEAVQAHLRKQKKTAAVRAALKGKYKAKASQKSEFITVNGEAHSARGAALLVNTTAQTYVKRANQRYRREVLSAIAVARRQLRQIESGGSEGKTKGKGGGGHKSGGATIALQAATLRNKINQLESNLTISQVAQVNPAKPKAAKSTGVHPKSNAIFGFVIGLMLAAFAAYGLGRLDRRMRSLAAIESAFGVEILTALQAVRKPIVSREGHPAPAKSLREGLWRLQTTLRVGPANAPGRNGATQLSRAPRVLLCVSAESADGKSTLVATLALALGEAGERVAVIEADFRRPVLGRMLGVGGQQGLADVLIGNLAVEEALQDVDFVRPGAGLTPAPTPSGGTATVVETAGAAAVLVGASKVENPPALLARPAMAELPRSLAEEYDFVLVDAPGPLQVSDALPLLAAVDGIVVVARVGHTRETSAARLMQLLSRTPSAPVLGIVANGVSQADIRRHGLSEQYARGWRHRFLGR